MKKQYGRWLFQAIGLAVVLSLAACGKSGAGDNKTQGPGRPFKIGLVYIGPHELINQVVVGFKDGMKRELVGTQYEIVERHANGDKTQVSATVNGAISNGLDILATITTPPSQMALKNAPATLPVVFVAVTDPVGAGLAKSLLTPELSSGVSDLAPLEKMLSVIHQLTPNVKKLGMPYSPEEQPAIFSKDLVTRLGPSMGFAIDARPVTSKDELPTLIRDLVRANDAVIVGADNGMFEASPMIAKIALDGRKPFYSADSSSVKAGAIAAVTIDYQKVGEAGAAVVAKVLRGQKVGTIPVTQMTDGVLELNQTSLKRLAIEVPEVLRQQVKTTYE
jgi:putative tryptophan/tyrosine transport system substrate-binding protein